MVDKRILRIQENIMRQHERGTASDEALADINSIVAEAKGKATMTGDQIRELRKREQLSQSQLATHMYLTANCIQKWERGVTHPKGPALAMLELIEKKGLAFLIS
ncbi:MULTISPECIES: helix-turn-helix domain-containing protein [Pantoea]|uniref:Helix-turn-helix domain-containing protein n=1 Tax=Candidatus Pantoea multigeneris TaxID=2608357 RepID=A0ABX0RE74_9GAMM|nr:MULTISPECIES: helix-turn-helix domain-containing protein [Pantoea]NIF23662.1 helix-turn-helix domain-containing protein [Pantoea multigeneris]